MKKKSCDFEIVEISLEIFLLFSHAVIAYIGRVTAAHFGEVFYC